MSRSTRYYIKDQYDNYFDNCDKFSEPFTTMGDVGADYMDCRKCMSTKKQVREALAYIKEYFSGKRLTLVRQVVIVDDIPIKDFKCK